MNEIQSLETAMAETGASYELVARVCGISERTVRRWIKGENSPSFAYRGLIKKAIRKLRIMSNGNG